MASRLSGLFNSYDFFGKSIPGVVLLLGLVTFLPESVWTATELEISIRNIAVLAVAGLVLGLIFGEGVHNLAINIEQMFYWSRQRAYDIYDLVNIKEVFRFFEITFGPTMSLIRGKFERINRGPPRVYKIKYKKFYHVKTTILLICVALLTVFLIIFYLPVRIIRLIVPVGLISRAVEFIRSIVSLGPISRAIGYLQRDNEPTLIYILPYGLWLQGRKWFGRRRQGVYKGLISHRNLFENRFRIYMSQYEDLDNGKTANIERFKDAYDETYNTDVREKIDEIGEVYSVVTTRLDALEYGRADNFQARYSFCRSMWVTLGLFLFAYITILLNQEQSQIEQILQTVPQRTVQLISQNTVWGRVVVGLAIGFIGGIILQHIIQHLFDYSLSENNPIAIIFSLFCYGSGVVATFEVEQTMLLTTDLVEDSVFLLITVVDWCLGFIGPLSDILVNVFLGENYASNTIFMKLLDGAHIQIVVLLTVIVAVFFDAAGDYKELYIDYLLVEFAEATSLENNDETLNLLHDIITDEEKTEETQL